MTAEQIEIADEISKDVKDIYDLLLDIYVELRLLRILAEMYALQSRAMKKRYKFAKKVIEEAPRASLSSDQSM